MSSEQATRSWVGKKANVAQAQVGCTSQSANQVELYFSVGQMQTHKKIKYRKNDTPCRFSYFSVGI
jgi:hypothetical protein